MPASKTRARHEWEGGKREQGGSVSSALSLSGGREPKKKMGREGNKEGREKRREEKRREEKNEKRHSNTYVIYR